MQFKYHSHINTKSLKLETSSLNELHVIADLDYVDGPLLSHYKWRNGDSYLFYWCEVNELYNRWLVFRVLDETLMAYLHQQVSLRHLILKPRDGFLYVVDVDDDWQYQHVYVTRPQDLPTNYYPKSDTHYDSEPLFYENENLPEHVFRAGLALYKKQDSTLMGNRSLPSISPKGGL